jgi:hypothetical protein
MDVLDAHFQRKYRSGVEMIMNLTKYSCPEICIIIQEISKYMDFATCGTYYELLRVIRFVIDAKAFGLKVQPKFDNNLGWNLKNFCDSDWEGDAEIRVSVTIFIMCLLDVPICWHSKYQNRMTLLSTEAKYVAISKAVTEFKFINDLLCDLHIKVNLPIVVRTENIGAIFVVENALTGF